MYALSNHDGATAKSVFFVFLYVRCFTFRQNERAEQASATAVALTPTALKQLPQPACGLRGGGEATYFLLEPRIHTAKRDLRTSPKMTDLLVIAYLPTTAATLALSLTPTLLADLGLQHKVQPTSCCRQ